MLQDEGRAKLLKLFSPVIAVIIAFLVGGLIVFISGANPIDAYAALLKGAFGSATGISNTIRYTLPIILLGLSFAICSRCGYFNIGQEGQMYAASLVIVWIQTLWPNGPDYALIPLMLAGAIVAGGVACLIPAIFKFLFGVNEIIVAFLMNYIMILLTTYLLSYSVLGAAGKTTPMSIIVEPRISGIVLVAAACMIVILYAVMMKRSVPGFRLRMIGHNSMFAQASGIRVMPLILVASFLGGAFSALSAAGEIFGVYHQIYNGFAGNLGFYGMTAALIGSQSIVGLVLGALILGALQSGSVSLAITTDIPSELVLVVQGLIMVFATINMLKYFTRKKMEGRTV